MKHEKQEFRSVPGNNQLLDLILDELNVKTVDFRLPGGVFAVYDGKETKYYKRTESVV